MGRGEIWINFVKIFLHSLHLTTNAQTSFLDIVNINLLVEGLLFSSSQ